MFVEKLNERTSNGRFKKGNTFQKLRKDRQPGYIKKKRKSYYIKKRYRKEYSMNPFTDMRGKKTGYKHTLETKEKLRKSAIRQLERQRIYCDTKPERMVENWLLFNNILYIKQYATGVGLSDFWLPENNIILEVDGEYWHNKPGRKERDVKQTNWLEENNYTVYRFTDRQIYDDIEGCLELIV